MPNCPVTFGYARSYAHRFSCHRGFELKSIAATQLKQIDDYAAQVAAYGLDEQLCTTRHWLRLVAMNTQDTSQRRIATIGRHW